MEITKRITDTIKIKKIMVEKGYNTISSLSKDSGINRTTLSKILNGTKQPSSDVMFKLVKVLDISPIEASRIFFYNHLT